jgi:hypothetical protein
VQGFGVVFLSYKKLLYSHVHVKSGKLHLDEFSGKVIVGTRTKASFLLMLKT